MRKKVKRLLSELTFIVLMGPRSYPDLVVMFPTIIAVRLLAGELLIIRTMKK